MLPLEAQQKLEQKANVSQLVISLQSSSFQYIFFYSIIFKFFGGYFSDRFSIFFIMLVIICSRGKGQIIK